MSTWLDDFAYEGGTTEVTVIFKDQDGVTFTPKTLTWTLYDGGGNVVNSRSAVSVTPASTVSIVLSGDDLVMVNEALDKEVRTVKFNGTYDTGAYTDLPFVEPKRFFLVNVEGE